METDEKYIVFKASEWPEGQYLPVDFPEPIDDFVVIRLGDIFAPPALYSYAGQVQSLLELLKNTELISKVEHLQDVQHGEAEEIVTRLEGIRDYFFAKATQAEKIHTRKVPD